MIRPLALAAALLAACDRYDDIGVVVGDACAQGVTRLRPAEDTTERWTGSTVVVDLWCPAPEGTLTVSVDGDAQPGRFEVAHGGQQLRFEPDPRWPASSTVDVFASTSAGDRRWTFTTGTLGEPGSGALTTDAWAVRVDAGTLLEPFDPEGLLLSALSDHWTPLVQPTAALMGEGDATFRWAARGGGNPASAQDGAVPTVDTTARWSDPEATTELGTSTVIAGVPWVSGTIRLVPGRGGPGALRIDGLVDTRPLPEPWGCASGCLPCPDDVQACLAVSLDAVPLEPWAGSLQEIVSAEP